MTNSSFHIYSASAGSGKTFTLAKSYLKLLIVSNNPEQFKNILAITFTNKAVGEMKTRIINMLREFSSENAIKNQHPMFSAVCEELQIKPEILQQKSAIVLKHLIHNYAAFDISTIDGFTHRVIRTFAFDLKLPVNFEVELDQDSLLNKAVESLIAKAGTDKELTKTLVDFAIEKADDDKSWDISFDFNKIAKLLVSENDLFYLQKLKDKTPDDFKNLKENVSKKIKESENRIVENAKQVLTLIEEAGLQFNDFSGAYLPKHFEKLANRNFSAGFEAKWQEDLNTKTLYPKRVAVNVVSIIEAIQPQIAEAFELTKAQIFDVQFLKAVHKNNTPLSVLNAIQNELNILKTDENKLLISEFNTLISNEIKNQPTPFIYERLGEKFKHYFIDEFQDTSKMQWQNLVPLLDNAMATPQGSTMLVGDAKQAIYRWRGGEAQQFMDLYNKVDNPFQIEAEVFNLDSNYRSFKEIVGFNNSFFNYISDSFFSDDNYKSLYKEAHQEQIKTNDGYVNLSFLDITSTDDKDELYAEKTYNTVKQCLENGYHLNDICILVRKKKEGIAVADYLTQRGISIVSSETLLLKNSPKVNLINCVMALIVNADDQMLKVTMLNGIAELLDIDNKHPFFKTRIGLPISSLFKSLNEFNIYLNYKNLLQMPLYEVAESIIRALNLVKDSDAYIQFYLDIVLEYSHKQTADISGFLEVFDKKKAKLSIALPNNLNAVTVMTVHKSKGLEFPVVIFPFADLDMYREIDPKSWFPLNKKEYSGFDYALLNYSKTFENYGETGGAIYQKHQSELQLDAINLLYVALTRAAEQLYIISKTDFDAKGVVNERTYSGLFINYLKQQNLWKSSKLDYSFGKPKRTSFSEKENEIDTAYTFISTAKESHNLKIITNSGYFWDTEHEEAIERGNLVHLILSKINTKYDVEVVFGTFLNSGQIKTSEVESLKNTIYAILSHPDLENYFTDDYTIYNEKDIITSDGLFIRPDRLVIKNDNATIIDYKTGTELPNHKTQLNNYALAVSAMNYKIKKKLLVYINDSIKIVEV